MRLFIVKVIIGRRRYAGMGCFLDQSEAISQTWADYPEARSVSAICLRGVPA